MGGNLYTQLPYVLDAERCFNLNINRFGEYQGTSANVSFSALARILS
jgi:hypothetical protein